MTQDTSPIAAALKAAQANAYNLRGNPYLWSSHTSDSYIIACIFAERDIPLRTLTKSRGHWWVANDIRCRVEGTPTHPLLTKATPHER
jgi:hypothetical protein